jgi:nucleotide-binding universal stress UspA family protein
VTVAVPPASAFGWGYGVFDIEREMREVFQGHLDDAAKGVPADVEVKTDLVFGTPVSKALAEAAADLDLLYVGSRGYGPLRRVLLGSISAHLVKHASCAVVVTPRGVAAEGAMDDDKVVAEHA